jgi:hypothetical protein
VFATACPRAPFELLHNHETSLFIDMFFPLSLTFSIFSGVYHTVLMFGHTILQKYKKTFIDGVPYGKKRGFGPINCNNCL